MTICSWWKNRNKAKAVDVKTIPKEVVQDKKQSVNPEYVEAQKYRGQKETDKKLQVKLVPYWKRIPGLSSFNSLIGTNFAWCMLFVFAMATDTGQSIVKSALAAVGGKDGQEINWRVDGIPKGARVWKNSGECKGSGNHIGWADADCSAEDLNKPAWTYPSFGGNQNNEVNTTYYCAKGDCLKLKDGKLVPDTGRICRVSWPDDLPLPGKVTKSVNCPKVQPKQGSTR